MDYFQPFLIIDKEETVLKTLRTLISKAFPNSTVYSARDGEKGWDFLVKPPRKPIVISTDKMPKLSGYQLLRRIRADENLNNTYFISITEFRENDQRKKALQSGADDYLTKPFAIEEIITKLKAATSIVEMKAKMINTDKIINGLKEDLEFDIKSIMDIIYEFQQNRMPDSSEALENIENASIAIAREIGDYTEKQLTELTYAARLCYTGKLCLPDKSINGPVMKKGFIANKIMMDVPEFASEVISKIRGFKNISDILYHLYENFDGSGFPDKLKNWQIPISSRILRVVMDFEEFFKINREKEDKAMEIIYHESKRLYDFNVVARFDQYLASEEYIRNAGIDIHMEFDELDEGMVLSRSIFTESGMLVLSAGMVLTEEGIDKLTEIRQSDPIIGKIFVRAKKKL